MDMGIRKGEGGGKHTTKRGSLRGCRWLTRLSSHLTSCASAKGRVGLSEAGPTQPAVAKITFVDHFNPGLYDHLINGILLCCRPMNRCTCTPSTSSTATSSPETFCLTLRPPPRYPILVRRRAFFFFFNCLCSLVVWGRRQCTLVGWDGSLSNLSYTGVRRVRE